MDEQEFLQLLESLLTPQTERVKAATAALNKKYYTSPSSLTALIHILTSHQSPALRQLAAVEARKLVSKHWSSIPADQKPTIRNSLLQTSLNEENTLARHSTARVIAAIAKIDLEDGEWTDLPNTLQQAAASETPRHREVAVYIIYTLLDTLGDFFMENLSNLFALFSKTIQDPDSIEVRANTMLALSRVAMLLDPEEDPDSTKYFQDSIPNMVAVLKNAIDSEDEDHAMQCFEVFQTLLGCESVLLQKHFGNLVKFMLELAIQTSIDDSYRTQALAFLHQCVKYRRLKVQSLKIGEEMTVKALQIVSELDADDDPDDEDATPARSALGLLDSLASSLPPNQVLVPLLHAIGPYVRNPNAQFRQAGMLALGMCVEGAPDFVATQLKEILPMVLHLLEDPEVRVRAATLSCIARLADDLAEEMGKEHQKLIPALVQNLDTAARGLQTPQAEQNLNVIKNNCIAVEALIEGLTVEDAARYVPELVPRISRLVEQDDLKTKMAAVGALGSVASASEKAFAPYFQETMQELGKYVELKESQDDLELRGAVCDSIGKIAQAVGAEAFKQFVGPLMQASEEALHLDHPRLRETTYIIWSTMAKVYEEDFEPWLQGVVKGLHDCLQQDEKELDIALGEEAKDLIGQEVTIAGRKLKVTAATDDDEDETIEVDDEDEDEDWDDIDGVTAVAMEKEISLEVIGDVLTHTRRKYLPYFQKTVEIVLQLVEHSYEGVRKAALGTLWRAYACLWGLAEGDGMAHWQPGLPLKVQPTEDLTKLGEMVMTATLATWQDEIDRGTVTDINRDLAATLKLCGPAVLIGKSGTVVPQITNQLLAIITKRHVCQQDLGDDGVDDDLPEESSEYDWLVIETACDALVSLSAALGPDFGELWKAFEKPVLKYASGGDALERNTAVGTIADCIGNMESAVTPYTSTLMKLLLHRLGDEDSDTKANAAYGVGLLCEKSNDAEVLKNYVAILGKLEPMLHDQQNPRVLDNAAGCVARMISKHPDKTPLQEVLPKLVELLPLREDYEENAPVYGMIVKLYQSGDDTMRQLTPLLKPVLEKVLGPPEEQLEEETRSQLLQLVKYLQEQG
ncbi:ARM repeat-containing protein [Rhizodiscina lignyota]|uniref:ARM repeat-containing protein n=1 Tax=Rhizodiscina lignyota TaxID=1504668 RepID=A0A9P4M5K6_9PEZI|nr:ARM repeat-containing protein [Rhizodiscina lignyota]